MAGSVPCVTGCTCKKHTSNPSYVTLHRRVYQSRGQARNQQCVACPAAARDWALIHTEDGTNPWADYVPLCKRCHFRYDAVNAQQRRLTAGQVLTARAELSQGASLRAVADRYGVSVSTVHQISRGRRGYHVNGSR